MMSGAGAVARVVAGGLTRRKVQSLVIGLVLLVSTGACVLALALVADSSAPFDRAFAAQHGADVVASVDRRGGHAGAARRDGAAAGGHRRGRALSRRRRSAQGCKGQPRARPPCRQ